MDKMGGCCPSPFSSLKKKRSSEVVHADLLGSLALAAAAALHMKKKKKDSSSFSLVSSAPAAPFRPVRGYIHPFDKEEELLHSLSSSFFLRREKTHTFAELIYMRDMVNYTFWASSWWGPKVYFVGQQKKKTRAPPQFLFFFPSMFSGYGVGGGTWVRIDGALAEE